MTTHQSKKNLINVADVDVNFYDKSKFENNAFHEPKNSVVLIFSNNENKPGIFIVFLMMMMMIMMMIY